MTETTGTIAQIRQLIGQRIAGTSTERSSVPGSSTEGGKRRSADVPKAHRDKRAGDWAVQEVRQNLTFTGDRIIAWYLAEPQNWSFRAVSDVEELISSQATQMAALTGNTIHCRVTTRPYPIHHWAHAAWANAPDPQPGFEKLMENDQLHMAAHAQADKLVYYGIDLGSRHVAVKTLSRMVAGAAEREMQALNDRLGAVNRIMSRPGFDARPAIGKDMEWLLARSFALGCDVPVPDPLQESRTDFDKDDLAEWMESVDWSAEPLAPTVQVTTSLNGKQVTRHVCVLTVSHLGEIEIPEKHLPWVAKSDALGFPVEWSFRVEPRSPEEISKEMTKISNRIDGQVSHWRDDHGKRPPKQLARQAARASDVEDEMRNEFTGLSTRTKGWYRIAVSGHSEAEALDKAQHVVELYGPQIKIIRQLGQYHLAREFVPGEPLSTRAHARKLPVLKVAAGLPAVTAEVGDKRGFHIGETAGMSARAVMFDPWYLTEVMETGGLVPFIGTLGAGKSNLMGMLTYKSILSGVRGVAMDPAGRMQKLLSLPEIAPLARSINVLSGHPGSLSPYGVVPEPNKALVRLDPEGNVLGDDEFEMRLALERTAAEQTRRDMAYTTLLACLPISMARNEKIQMQLRAAVMKASALRTSSAAQVVDILRSGGDEDRMISRELEAARDRELGRLFFAAEGQTQADRDRVAGITPARFTFYNLKGLLTPSREVPDDRWSPDELLARPIMTLAAWSSLNLIYRADPHERKLFVLDEAQEVTESSGGAGRALVYKLSTDSRKNNTASFIGTQNASTVLGTNIDNFVGACFVGRTQSESAQRDALKLLQKPEGAGYEEMLARLSARSRRSDEHLGYRDFVYRDGLGGDAGGGMEVIRVTMGHHPELMAALDTTASPGKRVKGFPDQLGDAGDGAEGVA
jgi:hypothetical protein